MLSLLFWGQVGIRCSNALQIKIQISEPQSDYLLDIRLSLDNGRVTSGRTWMASLMQGGYESRLLPWLAADTWPLHLRKHPWPTGSHPKEWTKAGGSDQAERGVSSPRETSWFLRGQVYFSCREGGGFKGVTGKARGTNGTHGAVRTRRALCVEGLFSVKGLKGQPEARINMRPAS